jgi:polypeptide N-acetylgalactosaminyltransferase
MELSQSGGFDPGMDLWGADIQEMSLRLWMCGGEIVMDRRAFVGHMFERESAWFHGEGIVLLDALKSISMKRIENN